MLILLCATLVLASPGPVGWRWPLTPLPHVLRGFEPPPRPWLRGHRGVDLAARPGQPVYAAGAGLVSYAGRLADRDVVTVLHGALRTTYQPVRPSVRSGQQITAGQRIGAVEDLRGHCGARLCLHWGLRRGLAYLDPLSLLGLGRVRLLPVWGSPTPAAVTPPDAVALFNDVDPQAREGRRRVPPDGPQGSPAERPPRPSLVSATAVSWGAAAGMIFGGALALAWRRVPTRRRLPPDVIDFTGERQRRRPPA